MRKKKFSTWATALLIFSLSLVVAPFAFAGPEGVFGSHQIGDGLADTPLEIDRLHHNGGITDGGGSGHQHGGEDGHLPGSSLNVELVGQLTVSDATPGRIADVGALGNYAYLAAYDDGSCRQAGVYVVDISDPTNPIEAGFIPTAPGSFVGEGVQAIPLDTRFFKGDLLVFNNEVCAETGSQIGGFSLFDVTDPLNPKPLVQGAGDTDPGGEFSAANQIHSAFAWQQGNRAFIVIVDDEELTDVDIFDITNPRKPKMVAEVGLEDWPEAQDKQAEGLGTFNFSFFHDVVVKNIDGDWLMLLSYWDAGFIVLNVNNPAKPVFVDETDFTDPDPETGISPPEGNAHEAEWSANNEFILATDEDFDVFHISSFTSSAFSGSLPAIEANFTPPIYDLSGSQMSGEVVHVGRGCPPGTPELPEGDPYLADPAGKIALIERGLCFFDNKVAWAQLNGAVGVIVYNSEEGGEELFVMGGNNPVLDGSPQVIGTEITIPAIMVQRSTGLLLASGDQPVTATAVSQFNGWGYLHLFNARNLRELDTYAIPEALDPAFARGFGDLSIHEVTTDPEKKLAYVSYYAGGFRVLKFAHDGFEEVGHYIHENGNNFWGVQVYQPSGGGNGDTLVLASDMDSGLWIFRYTGNGDPD